MEKKYPCELIRDLFPSYIEGLTGSVTNTIVEEHTAECDACKQVLEAMREPSVEPEADRKKKEEEKKEIDFLKKTKRENQKIAAGSMLAAAGVVLLVILALIAKIYFVGSSMDEDSVACEIQVDGNQLTLYGVAVDEGFGIASAQYAQEDGVVTVSLKAVRESWFHKGEYRSDYTAKQEITRVCLGDRILWDHGANISALTSAVYQTGHDYVGNMPENVQTAIALNMYAYLGNFTSELQTGTEPYSWKLLLENEIGAFYKDTREKQMRAYAYILLGVIGNLGEVSYEYTVDGVEYTITVTEEEASAFAGADIKECGQDILCLQELIEKIGLDTYAYAGRVEENNAAESSWLNIVNNTDEDIAGIGISYYLDGKLCSSEGGENADGSLMEKGESMGFELMSYGSGDMTIEVSVYDKNNHTYELEAPIHISGESGLTYYYTLTGNAQDGFAISQ